MPPLPANFCILVEMGFCHVSQADLTLLTSSDLPASASQRAGITVTNHCPTLPSVFSKPVFAVRLGFTMLTRIGLYLLTS